MRVEKNDQGIEPGCGHDWLAQGEHGGQECATIEGKGELHAVFFGHGSLKKGSPRALNEVSLQVIKAVEQRPARHDACRSKHDSCKRPPGRGTRAIKDGQRAKYLGSS